MFGVEIGLVIKLWVRNKQNINNKNMFLAQDSFFSFYCTGLKSHI